jgi:uncharacterized membrane protein (UPF0127 family)
MRLIAGVFVLLAVGCGKQPVGKPPPTNFVAHVPSGVPTQVQPKLPTIKMFVGTVAIEVEQAITETQIQTGMMFRKSMGPNEGMLFVHPDVKERGYWMKNVSVPLSIAYLDPAGRIVEIHDLKPFETKGVFSVSRNIQYALETPQGWFKRNGIVPRVMLMTEKGTLPETYFPRR